MAVDIYELNYPNHNPIWLIDRFGVPLVAGANPIKTIKAIIANSLYYYKYSNYKSLNELICRKFKGISLAHQAYKWLKVSDDGKVDWRKNREGVHHRPPFMSIEEMFIFCNLSNWPEPRWLDDIVDEMAHDFIDSWQVGNR